MRSPTPVCDASEDGNGLSLIGVTAHGGAMKLHRPSRPYQSKNDRFSTPAPLQQRTSVYSDYTVDLGRLSLDQETGHEPSIYS